MRRCVDGCPHTFAELATRVLPSHMEKLHESLRAPWPAGDFARRGVGVRAIARELGLRSDFSGCYVLVDQTGPIYVGISRGVLARVRQHVFGSTHFDASLAYMVAQRRQPTPGHRAVVMQREQFKAAFETARDYLRGLHVGTVGIDNSLELHLFEAYAAMELGTAEWNSFRTH